MLEAATEVDRDLLGELDRLERIIQEVQATMRKLRDENRVLEGECARLREERNVTVDRLTRLIDKVDALRGES
jgi:predicted nuclease with TOPRIM domain